MYKRHFLGTPEDETTKLGGVVTFFAFCAVVVWVMPLGIEAVSGHSVEMFMIPPIWRAEIMCATPDEPDDRDYTYILDGNTCIKKHDIPGHVDDGTTKPKNSDEAIAANVAKARAGLDLYDIFQIVMLALKTGTPLVALISLGILRMGAAVGRPSWGWLCVPCGAAAVAAAFEPALLPAGLAVWAAAYTIDMWSTSRFGKQQVARYEINPILRALVRRCSIRAAFILHTIIYAPLVVGLPWLMGMAGPLSWEEVAGVLVFVLGGAHMWAAASNIREYGYTRLV